MYVISITTSGQAFLTADKPELEVAQALRKLAYKIQHENMDAYDGFIPIRDSKGEQCGQCEITDDDI